MKKHTGFFLWIIYLTVIGLFVSLNNFSLQSTEPINLVVNIALFVIVFIIFLNASKGFYRLTKIEKELERVKTSFRDLFFEKSTGNTAHYIWNDIKNDEHVFEHAFLKQQFLEYQQERKRLEALSEENVSCDIEDYINTAMLDHVMNKTLFSTVPGVMTGLGILGTFIGLSYGLQSFNTGTSDMILESISPLMDGIKVAFHTSIYGMIFSLGFNYLFKNRLEHSYRVVRSFLDDYKKYVSPATSDDMVGKLIHYGKEQEQHWIQFIDCFAKMEQMIEKKMDYQFFEYTQSFSDYRNQFETFADRFRAMLSEVMTPQLEAMNKIVQEFVSISTDRQMEGIRELTDTFMKQMNDSMGNSFTVLGQTIEESCALQKKNAEFVQSVFDKLQSVSHDMQENQEISEKTIVQLHDYMNSLAELQHSIHADHQNLSEAMEKTADILENQSQYINDLAVLENSILETIKTNSEESMKCTEALHEVGERLSEQSEKSVESLQKAGELLQEQAIKNAELLKATGDSLREQADRNAESLQRAGDTLNEQVRITLEEIQKKTQEWNKELLDTVERYISNISSEGVFATKQISESLKELSNRFMEGVKQESEAQTRFMVENTNAINTEMEEGLRRIIACVEQEIKNVTGIADGIDTNIQKSTEALVRVCNQMNNQLSLSVTETFVSFDNALSDIMRRLSGTVSQINDTTSRVPKIVDASYSDMDKALKRLGDEMRTMTNHVNEMNKVMQRASQHTKVE